MTKYVGAGPDSQLYIYRVDRDGEPFVCCFCVLDDGISFKTHDPAEMAGHVDMHKAAGLRTPDGLAARFRAMAP